jgi:hypothetical protein
MFPDKIVAKPKKLDKGWKKIRMKAPAIPRPR